MTDEGSHLLLYYEHLQVHLVFAAEARVTKIVYRCWSLFYDSGRIWNESGTAILNIFHRKCLCFE